jgi:replication factor A1
VINNNIYKIHSPTHLKMEIKDLQPRQGKVEIVLEVTEKGEVREFEKFGKKGKVCSCKAKDNTGEIILSLWNEQVDQVKTGDKVKVSNGYIGEWQGEKQLSTGKFGTLEVVTGETEDKPEPVYTNVPPQERPEENLGQELEQMQNIPDPEMPKEQLSDDVVKDEEYIG